MIGRWTTSGPRTCLSCSEACGCWLSSTGVGASTCTPGRNIASATHLSSCSICDPTYHGIRCDLSPRSSIIIIMLHDTCLTHTNLSLSTHHQMMESAAIFTVAWLLFIVCYLLSAIGPVPLDWMNSIPYQLFPGCLGLLVRSPIREQRPERISRSFLPNCVARGRSSW